MMPLGFVGLGFFVYRGTKKNSAALTAPRSDSRTSVLLVIAALPNCFYNSVIDE
jgi:hypothetical protein